MPNGRLSETFEDINCELIKRVDSTTSSYQPSPKTTRRLQSLSGSHWSSDDLNRYPSLPKIVTPYEYSYKINQKEAICSF